MEIETDDCPFPEVAEALGPFIKTRDEVAAIRRGLQDYLQKQIPPSDGAPLSSVNLMTATTSRLDSAPAGLTGVRKSYWKALQAHADAQAKYDALRLELEQLKHQKSNDNVEGVARSSPSVNETYIPLLRQKERHRKLKAIEHAYDNIMSAGDDLHSGSVDDLLKKRIGDFPNPPSLPSQSRDPQAEGKVMELRKAVIAIKRRIEERKLDAPSNFVDDTNDISPEAEVAGLQSGLQELTLWMEEQLTIISNAEGDPEPSSSPAENGTARKTQLSTTDIEDLYQQYISARERLIQNVNEPREARPDASIVDVVSEPASRRDIGTPLPLTKSASEAILPYVPVLTAGKEHEHALIQQNAYIRRHLASSEADTERLIRRMADESHLVQPGASQGKDWAAAGREADSATNDFVKRRIEIGEAAASSAKETLDTVRSLPGSLNRMTMKGED